MLDGLGPQTQTILELLNTDEDTPSVTPRELSQVTVLATCDSRGDFSVLIISWNPFECLRRLPVCECRRSRPSGTTLGSDVV